MKKTKIFDFFQSQPPVVNVPCPACGISLMKSKLNDHLDSSCSSLVLSTVSVINNSGSVKVKSSRESSRRSRRKNQETTNNVISNRLSLKRPKTKLNKNINRKLIKVDEQTENDDDIKLIEVDEQNESDDDIKLIKVDEQKESDDDIIVLEENLASFDKITKFEISSSACSSQDPKLKTRSPNSEYDIVSYKERNFVVDLKIEVDKCYSDKTLEVCSKTTETYEQSIIVEKNIPDFQAEVDLNHDIAVSEQNSSEKCVVSSRLSLDTMNILKDAKVILENDNVFSELSDSNENEEKKNDVKNYDPYYIANFKHILESVLNEEENQILFNEEDLKSIEAFKTSSDAAQKLYVRLFQRKYKWLRINKINYPNITQDPHVILEELVKCDLVDSGASEIDLETALELLSLPEAKSLAKHFNFNSGKNKSDIKQMLLKHCKEHKSVFFMNGANGVSNMMLKKVRQTIGPCYRISLIPKRVFTRVLMLFSLPTMSDDDEEAAGGQQQQLITLLQVNKGELVFPNYKRTKKTVIFFDRNELIRYEEARQVENDIYNAVESKNFELAKDLYINAKEEFEDQCTRDFAKRAASLPTFLKRYTSFHVYVRCMTQGVEALQRLRQYKEAVSLLKRLLKQTVYCQDYKGRWYDRLALNLEQHLKQPEKALKAIKSGLKDTNVRVGPRYSLITRALRITKSLDETDEFRQQILKDAAVIEAPKVTIKGRLCPRPVIGRRHVFISSSTTDIDEVTVLGVEQLAIEHYREEGFPEGIHGEGSTFISIYALLFWDIIYDGNIPDVFISPYQTHPLDLNSESFFLNRKDQILNHLKTLKQSTNEALREIVKTTWENHHGQASLVSWDHFTDLEHVQGLICCFGSDILSGICERLAKDFRFTRSGVPDLVVWNPETLCVKIVEVKGPGDKLSSKQILWLDYLIQLGADAEVCLVEAVGSKKLRKETF
ncbi:hypothetical protein TNCT_126071 [Trichonephila clavata]|uniref:Fanconi-associated nuclease n=1 Tax=Trichonephila clavata TaxID=2740835 RepID=A0A8X6M467_TRICU|nr:hypothetical protein TNCT_126071 [Trichonephila clavata]